jgi:hypothetical protein
MGCTAQDGLAWPVAVVGSQWAVKSALLCRLGCPELPLLMRRPYEGGRSLQVRADEERLRAIHDGFLLDQRFEPFEICINRERWLGEIEDCRDCRVSLTNKPRRCRFPSNAAIAPLMCGTTLPIGFRLVP